MNKILFYAVFFHLTNCYPSLELSYEEASPRASTLFPHIENPATRIDYFYALDQIRKGQQIFDTFFTINPDLSDFYFYAEQKRHFKIDTDGVGRLKRGAPITIPIWVETAYRKNWNALAQLLIHSPVIVTERYNGNPFCKIVFSASPPKKIIEQIIEITNMLNLETHPFLELEANVKLLPFSSLNLETSDDAVTACLDVSLHAIKDPSKKKLFYESAAHLCARHIVEGSNSFLLTMPISKKWDHNRTILLNLINEEKYHGFHNYFAFLTKKSLSCKDFSYLISAGLNHFALKGNKDISQEVKVFFSTALGYFPNQELNALRDLACCLRDEYHATKTIDHTTLSARTVLEIIEQQCNDLEQRKRQKTA
jgi:hypothetical protein